MSERAGGDGSLSVCCMTAGHGPERTAALLELFRPVADEIVVAVDEARAEAAAPALSPVADRILSYPYAPPPDSSIPWVFDQCSCAWILNVDDDEVPSRRLLRELPDVLARRDLTHGWIARRWLYRGPTTYLDEPPWSTEFQLRLVRSRSPFVQFSAEFHRPVVAHGPCRFVDAPLWHLDFLVKDEEQRREKALWYERERRGMRIAGVSHNTGLYVPELRDDARIAAVPDDDAADIRRVLAGATPGQVPAVQAVSRAEVGRHWPGPPFSDTVYDARLELRDRPSSFVAGVQQTVDILVENRGETVWRWGEHGEPEIRLSYRWLHADGSRVDQEGLRTPFPSDVEPGEAQVVPVHVVGPREPGGYRLELDLVHEHVRWFDRGVGYHVEVRPRRRIAVVGAGEPLGELLDALALVPELEPVLVARGADAARIGLPLIAGARRFLGEDASRARLVLGAYRLRSAARRRPHGEFLQGLAGCEALVLASPDWPAGAPVARELWRLRATVAAAKQLGLRVLALDGAPGVENRKTNALARSIRRQATVVPTPAELAAALRRERLLRAP